MSINQRLRSIIDMELAEKNKFGLLEKISSIPQNTWRTWYVRNSFPNALMIESVSKNWPQYAFWLVTGVEDGIAGHQCPAIPSSELNNVTKKHLEAIFDLKREKLSTSDFEIFKKTELMLRQIRLDRICSLNKLN